MPISTVEFSFPRRFLVKVYQKRYSSPFVEYSASYVAPNCELKRCAVRTINEDRLLKQCQLQLPDDIMPQKQESKILIELRKLSIDVSKSVVRINLFDIVDQPFKTDNVSLSSVENETPVSIERINFTLPYSFITKALKNKTSDTSFRLASWYLGKGDVVLPCVVNTTCEQLEDGEDRLTVMFESLILDSENPFILKFLTANADHPLISVNPPVLEPVVSSPPKSFPFGFQPLTTSTASTTESTDDKRELEQNSTASVSINTNKIQPQTVCSTPPKIQNDPSYDSLVNIEAIIAKRFSPPKPHEEGAMSTAAQDSMNSATLSNDAGKDGRSENAGQSSIDVRPEFHAADLAGQEDKCGSQSPEKDDNGRFTDSAEMVKDGQIADAIVKDKDGQTNDFIEGSKTSDHTGIVKDGQTDNSTEGAETSDPTGIVKDGQTDDSSVKDIDGQMEDFTLEVSKMTDATEINNTSAATEVRQAADATEIRQTADATEIRQAADSTEIRQAADSTEIRQADDSTEIRQAADSTEIRQAADSTEISKTSAATEIRQAADATERDKEGQTDSTEIGQGERAVDVTENSEEKESESTVEETCSAKPPQAVQPEDGDASGSQKESEKVVHLLDAESGVIKIICVENDEDSNDSVQFVSEEIQDREEPPTEYQTANGMNNTNKDVHACSDKHATSNQDGAHVQQSVEDSAKDDNINTIVANIMKNMEEKEWGTPGCPPLPLPTSSASQPPPIVLPNNPNCCNFYIPVWKVDFPWIVHDKKRSVMFCQVCVATGKKNQFTTFGCTTLEDVILHSNLSDHNSAIYELNTASSSSTLQWKDLVYKHDNRSTIIEKYCTAKTAGCFVNYWSKEFPWLVYDDVEATLYCKLCQRNGQTTNYSRGVQNFHRQGIINHSNTKSHRDAFLLENATIEKKNLEVSTQSEMIMKMPANLEGEVSMVDAEKEIGMVDPKEKVGMLDPKENVGMVDSKDDQPLRWNRITSLSSQPSANDTEPCKSHKAFKTMSRHSSDFNFPLVVMQDISRSPDMKVRLSSLSEGKCVSSKDINFDNIDSPNSRKICIKNISPVKLNRKFVSKPWSSRAEFVSKKTTVCSKTKSSKSSKTDWCERQDTPEKEVDVDKDILALLPLVGMDDDSDDDSLQLSSTMDDSATKRLSFDASQSIPKLGLLVSKEHRLSLSSKLSDRLKSGDSKAKPAMAGDSKVNIKLDPDELLVRYLSSPVRQKEAIAEAWQPVIILEDIGHDSFIVHKSTPMCIKSENETGSTSSNSEKRLPTAKPKNKKARVSLNSEVFKSVSRSEKVWRPLPSPDKAETVNKKVTPKTVPSKRKRTESPDTSISCKIMKRLRSSVIESVSPPPPTDRRTVSTNSKVAGPKSKSKPKSESMYSSEGWSTEEDDKEVTKQTFSNECDVLDMLDDLDLTDMMMCYVVLTRIKV